MGGRPPGSAEGLSPSPLFSLVANFASASAGALVQATLLQPVDQALYLAVISGTPLLRAENWKRPYLNFTQSVSVRVIQSGSYFFLQRQFDESARGALAGAGVAPLLVGLIAGVSIGIANGVLTTPLSCLKHYTI